MSNIENTTQKNKRLMQIGYIKELKTYFIMIVLGHWLWWKIGWDSVNG